MNKNKMIDEFLSNYSYEVSGHALQLREVLLSNLPGIIEQIDLPAKMIAYCYGQRYKEMVCTLIPSKTGIKLGFYKGFELNDPYKLLAGTGKISRYVEIRSEEQVKADALRELIANALIAYRKRML